MYLLLAHKKHTGHFTFNEHKQISENVIFDM